MSHKIKENKSIFVKNERGLANTAEQKSPCEFKSFANFVACISVKLNLSAMIYQK